MLIYYCLSVGVPEKREREREQNQTHTLPTKFLHRKKHEFEEDEKKTSNFLIMYVHKNVSKQAYTQRSNCTRKKCMFLWNELLHWLRFGRHSLIWAHNSYTQPRNRWKKHKKRKKNEQRQHSTEIKLLLDGVLFFRCVCPICFIRRSSVREKKRKIGWSERVSFPPKHLFLSAARRLCPEKQIREKKTLF